MVEVRGGGERECGREQVCGDGEVGGCVVGAGAADVGPVWC